MKKDRKIKRSLSAIIVFVMVALSICQTAVFANGSSELENAIVKVKSLIDIPNELTNFNSDKYSVGNGVEYQFSWSLPGDKLNSEYPENTCNRVNVSVNSYGDIDSYSKNFINVKSGKTLAKFSDEEYKEMAVEWLNKVIPDIAAEYEFESLNSSVNNPDVALRFERIKNGLNYCNNYISIGMDKKSGEIESYRLSHLYTNNGAELSEVIDENAKREGFIKQNSFEKRYIRKSNTQNAVLIYVPSNPSVVLDATTGEIPKLTAEEEKSIEEDKNFYREMNAKSMNTSASAGSGGASPEAAVAEDSAVELSEAELSAISDYSKLIAPEEAEKLIRGIENTVIDEYELLSYEYYKAKERDYPMPIYNDKGEEIPQTEVVKDVYYAQFYFTKESNTVDAKYYYGDASVTINAETGELINFYSYSYSSDETEKTSLDKAKRESNALAFIRKYSPNEADKVKNFDTENENLYNFTFHQNVDGIKYVGNYINVGVDEYSGKITRFSKNWKNGIKFESSENILSEGDIANVLFNKVGFEQYYTNIAYVEYAPAIRLVYELKYAYPYYVSATSGNLLDYDGTVKTEQLEEEVGDKFLDIEGHYAEDIINILVENGVIEIGTDRMFKPDLNLKYEDAKDMLRSIGYNAYNYERYYGKNEGDYIATYENLTRIGAVECILDSVGYGKAARLGEIYNCTFADTEALGENVGYAMVAKALGIVNGDENGCFNPSVHVTRADFAIMIYNLLVSDRIE